MATVQALPILASKGGSCAVYKQQINLSPNFKTFKEPMNRFQGINSAGLCNLAARYDNPIPTRFLAPVDFFLQIPALFSLHGEMADMDPVCCTRGNMSMCPSCCKGK